MISQKIKQMMNDIINEADEVEHVELAWKAESVEDIKLWLAVNPQIRGLASVETLIKCIQGE